MQTLRTRPAEKLLLSGNALKIIAAVTMTIDHIGYIFFPLQPLWRCIGRLAMPIFAFMISEGCQHTRRKLRYFLSVLLLAVVCQTAYTVSQGDWFLCVPVSYAMSILTVYILQAWKAADRGKWLWGTLFFAAVAAVYGLTRFLRMDYGFWGCMLAVFASLPHGLEQNRTGKLSILSMGVGLVMLALEMGPWQWWSLLSLPLLFLYSGRRGKWKMKYFFYIFYPAHLVVLEGLFLLIYR